MRTSGITGSLLVLAFASASCVHVSAGPEEEFFNVDSIVDVYGNVNGLDDWDYFDLGLFTDDKGHNEIFHIEIGPFFEFGFGLVGTRVRVLPLQFGVGSLFYSARPKEPHVVEATIEDDPQEKTEPAKPENEAPDPPKTKSRAPDETDQ